MKEWEGIDNEWDGVDNKEAGLSDEVAFNLSSDDSTDYRSFDDEDTSVSKKKQNIFDPTSNMHSKLFKLTEGRGGLKFEVGKVFSNVFAFREALRDYVVSEGYDIQRPKTQSYGIAGTCKGKNYN